MMKNRFMWMAAICLPLLVCSCQTDNNALSSDTFKPDSSGYRLVWEDHFEGDTLSNDWYVRGVGARRVGFNDGRMVQVKDGVLHLVFDQTGDSVLASAIASRRYYTYGYFEIRAQLQKSVGPWAAFWMQSDLVSKGEDPGKFGAEIDIFEYFNELGADTLTHAVHWAYGPNQKTSGRMDSYLKGLHTGFHTFALEWTPEKYVFYIDGLKFKEQSQGVSHIGEYLILSMEIRDTMDAMKQAFPTDTFKIDYIKVYQNPELSANE